MIFTSIGSKRNCLLLFIQETPGVTIRSPVGECFAEPQDEQPSNKDEIATEFNRCRVHVVKATNDEDFDQDDKRGKTKQEDGHGAGNRINGGVLLAQGFL